MSTLLELTPELLARLRVRYCNSRYCGWPGLFVPHHIAGTAPHGSGAVGFCQTCEKFICSDCAILRPLPIENGPGLAELLCRFCGAPLGKGSERLILPPPEGLGLRYHAQRRLGRCRFPTRLHFFATVQAKSKQQKPRAILMRGGVILEEHLDDNTEEPVLPFHPGWRAVS